MAQESSKAEEIRKVAAQELARHGPAGVTFRSVAHAAKCPASLVNYHFATRNHLIDASFEAYQLNFRHELLRTEEDLRQLDGIQLSGCEEWAYVLEVMLEKESWMALNLLELLVYRRDRAPLFRVLLKTLACIRATVRRILMHHDPTLGQADVETAFVISLGLMMRIASRKTSIIDLLMLRPVLARRMQHHASGKDPFRGLVKQAQTISPGDHPSRASIRSMLSMIDESTSAPEKIALAALHLLENRGIETITHRDIAETAGVSLSATTYHFDSKVDIFRSAYSKIHDLTKGALGPVDAPFRGQQAQSIRELILSILEYYMGPGRQLAMANLGLALGACRQSSLKSLAKLASRTEFEEFRTLAKQVRLELDTTDVNLAIANLDGLVFLGILKS